MEVSFVPSLGFPISEEASGNTRSAIQGEVIITDQQAQLALTGQTAEQTVDNLNRDTANAHTFIENTFDKEEYKEKQELARVFAEEAFRLVGDIAKSKTKDYESAEAQKKRAEEYQKLKDKQETGELSKLEQNQLANINLTPEIAESLLNTANETIAKEQSTYDFWKEGGVGKVALHTLVGVAQASLGDGNIAASALGAGATESIRGLTADQSKTVQELASLVIGGTAGLIAGGDQTSALSGASSALAGEQFNRQLHLSEAKILKEAREKISEQGLSKEELAVALYDLDALACVQTQCAAGVPKDDENYEKLHDLQTYGEQLNTEGYDLYSTLEGLDTDYVTRLRIPVTMTSDSG